MNGFRRMFSIYSIIGLVIFGFAAQANAQGARSEKEVRRIVRNLNAKIEDFRVRFSNETDQNSPVNQKSGNLENSLNTLEQRMREFDTKLNSYRENSADVSIVLNAARTVNDAVKSNRLTNKTRNEWAEIRMQFEQLASNYNINWRWEGNNNYGNNNNGINNNNYPDDDDITDDRYPNENRMPANTMNSSALSGTYRLDVSRSENTDEIADRAIDNSNARSNSQAREDLQDKLQAPDQITVEVRGTQVSLSSSRAAPITFNADGRDQSEPGAGGKTLRVRSTLRGDELTVSSLGGETDYTVIFTSIDNGKAMRVTRRITTEYLNQTVFVESIYVKTDAVAQLGTSIDSDNSNGSYSSNDTTDSNYPNDSTNNYPVPVNGRTGNFVVPNGTILTGILETDISTKASQNNDRFRMTVNAPNQFRGAIVEGHLNGLNRSGKVSGRSQITFNFETIRLANGQTYDFAGFLQNVTDANGKTIKVDAEGTAQGNNQTKETVKRGGIGAGIGAIIGAIAGGGQGAAIGAVIGGSAGAGSVYVQGKDDLELRRGSSITVQSSSPLR